MELISSLFNEGTSPRRRSPEARQAPLSGLSKGHRMRRARGRLCSAACEQAEASHPGQDADRGPHQPQPPPLDPSSLVKS